jgi:NAD(P)-dependent dehydrogenase (short-subunit alcohol dehydrogenase family)
MQIAIVTGGSSGIGQSAAVEIARRGAGVILTYNANAEGAKQTVADIEALGGTAVALPLDLGQSETFPAFRDEVARALTDTWGADGITGLVNNAGFAQMAMFEDTTEEQLDRLYDGLLKGPFLLTQTLLPLLADGGAVVNVASNAAMPSGMAAGYSAYGSMKGALIVLSRFLAKELSVRGIRVTSVAPGATRTRLGDDAFTKFPEVIEPIVANTALGRVGEPEDIGKVIAFLLSDDGAWITAENLEVAGGYGL